MSTSQTHPSPSRQSRSAKLLLYLAIFGAPVAWYLQLTGAASWAGLLCHASDVPPTTSSWTGLWATLLAITLAAIAVAVVSGLATMRHWRGTTMSSENISTALETGRSQYVKLWGVLIAAQFLLGLAFALCAVLIVPICNA